MSETDKLVMAAARALEAQAAVEQMDEGGTPVAASAREAQVSAEKRDEEERLIAEEIATAERLEEEQIAARRKDKKWWKWLKTRPWQGEAVEQTAPPEEERHPVIEAQGPAARTDASGSAPVAMRMTKCSSTTDIFDLSMNDYLALGG